MRLGVISDTHIPTHAARLPAAVTKHFAGVDRILHAGDLEVLEVLDALQAIAPVTAVAGNADRPEVVHRLPERQLVTVDGIKIGLTHGHIGPERSVPERAAAHFPEADVIVFGHTHMQRNQRHEGRLFFNPGSATHRHLSDYCSVGLLDIQDGQVRGRIIALE